MRRSALGSTTTAPRRASTRPNVVAKPSRPRRPAFGSVESATPAPLRRVAVSADAPANPARAAAPTTSPWRSTGPRGSGTGRGSARASSARAAAHSGLESSRGSASSQVCCRARASATCIAR